MMVKMNSMDWFCIIPEEPPMKLCTGYLYSILYDIKNCFCTLSALEAGADPALCYPYKPRNKT